MKKRVVIFLIVFVIILFFLNGLEKEIELHQPMEEITQIDLLYSPWNEFKVIYTLDEEEIPDFLDAFLKLRLHKGTSPEGIYGTLIVQLTYSDGAQELFGTGTIYYYPDGRIKDAHSEHVHGGWYSLYTEDLYNLFCNYKDLSGWQYLEKYSE